MVAFIARVSTQEVNFARFKGEVPGALGLAIVASIMEYDLGVRTSCGGGSVDGWMRGSCKGNNSQAKKHGMPRNSRTVADPVIATVTMMIPNPSKLGSSRWSGRWSWHKKKSDAKKTAECNSCSQGKACCGHKS